MNRYNNSILQCFKNILSSNFQLRDSSLLLSTPENIASIPPTNSQGPSGLLGAQLFKKKARISIELKNQKWHARLIQTETDYPPSGKVLRTSRKTCWIWTFTSKWNLLAKMGSSPTDTPLLPSASSKGKQTTTGSHDSSLDSQKEGSTIKNATPSIEKKQAPGRGRSEGKHVMTCRIVNSKKLPFQLRPQNIKRYRQGLEEMTVDISAILKKESSEPFMSKDSLQNLCLYF